ncbi:hypothetical protein AVEN_53751-1 [Araneus ventricosus]|uniref:Uncharacterized protein n=1 Tax=Araneus ventricosus TaxID=182803 RepID=A0A4Y2MYV0_ARAVE|nr:hypothetical protein AVEN_53751-1 [Araneus ventricosus]
MDLVHFNSDPYHTGGGYLNYGAEKLPDEYAKSQFPGVYNNGRDTLMSPSPMIDRTRDGSSVTEPVLIVAAAGHLY